mmetsp:Transcript_134942/g.248105  ORF Transcript_134942/g.248105 Transcript_134942/m.248105 type:complete len:788 (-) Transcript_134942:104-2467(-)
MSRRTWESLENQGRQLLASRVEAAGFTHAEEHTIDMLMHYTMEYLGTCVAKGLECAKDEGRQRLSREDLNSAIDHCAGRFGGLAPNSTEAKEWLGQHREQQGRGPIVVTSSCMSASSSSTSQLGSSRGSGRSSADFRRVAGDRQGGRQLGHRLESPVAEPPSRMTSHTPMWGEMSWCYTCGQERQGRFCSECTCRLGLPMQSIPAGLEDVLPLPQQVIQKSGVDEAQRKAEEAKRKAADEQVAAEAAIEAAIRKAEEAKRKLAQDQAAVEAAAETAAETARKKADLAKKKAAHEQAAAEAAAEAAIKRADTAKKKAAHEQASAEAAAETAVKKADAAKKKAALDQAAAETAAKKAADDKAAAEAAAKKAAEDKAAAQKAAEAAAKLKADAERATAVAAQQAGEEKAPKLLNDSNRQFMVTLDKTDGATVGMKIWNNNSGNSGANAAIIESIQAGLIVEWNALHRDLIVAPGDSLVKVNDACARDAMLAELRKNQVLRILVHKADGHSSSAPKLRRQFSRPKSQAANKGGVQTSADQSPGPQAKRTRLTKVISENAQDATRRIHTLPSPQASIESGAPLPAARVQSDSIASDADKSKPGGPQRLDIRARLRTQLLKGSKRHSTTSLSSEASSPKASDVSSPMVKSSVPVTPYELAAQAASNASASQALPVAQPTSSALLAPQPPAAGAPTEITKRWVAGFTSQSSIAKLTGALLGSPPTRPEASKAADNSQLDTKSEMTDAVKDASRVEAKSDIGSQFSTEGSQEVGAGTAAASGAAAAARHKRLKLR